MTEAERIAAGPHYTCNQARELFSDELPPFMASSPTIILRSYGQVNVTQDDIDAANRAILEANRKVSN